MKGPLVHGCYDLQTFKTLSSVGVETFAFDLRARSSNLVTYRQLRDLLGQLPVSDVILIFAEDSADTIASFLDLLKDTGKNFHLEFRDQQVPTYYERVGRPFYWYFSPDADWSEILKLKNCVGVFLPLRYQNLYHQLPQLWAIIEAGNLAIWLHAETLAEASFFEGKTDVQVSVDLFPELQRSYRTVDQATLRTMSLWRKLNESPAGQ